MTTVRLDEVVARYDVSPVLDHVDLVAESHQITAVLGPSGCGKTTALRVVAGLHRPVAGTVSFDDRIVDGPGGRHVRAERRRVGIVPQDGALFPHLSVAGNVAFGLAKSADRMDRVFQLLDLVGLPAYGERSPHELSGGEQQRVALARALAPRPDVIVLDEPFAALDAQLRQDVRRDVCAVLRAEGATALLVTHDQDEALSAADSLAVMQAGRIVQQGRPAHVYRNPADLWIARFLGDAVVLPVEGVAGAVHCALGTVRVPDKRISGSGSVMIRPEQIAIVADGDGVPAKVDDVEYFGHDALVRLAVSGETVAARVLAADVPERGDLVDVTVNGEGRYYPA